MIRLWFLMLVVFYSFSAFAITTTDPIDISPQMVAKPIPPGFHFMTPEKMIDHWIATSDIVSERHHAWDLWNGMSVDSGETYNFKELPIWETWYGAADVFTFQPNITDQNAIAFLSSHRKSLRTFVEPHQFRHIKLGFSDIQVAGPKEVRLFSFNKFNPSAGKFIFTPHPGPGGQTFQYNSTESLSALTNAFPPGTSAEDRGIIEFPTDAIEAKPVFTVVYGKGLTPIPLWRGSAESTNPEYPTQDTWKNCVLVDPNGKTDHLRPATKAEIARINPDAGKGLSCQTYLYGSLSLLYSFHLNSAESASVNKIRGDHVTTNDYAVMIAMHVNTHEIPFWTWQTFYWQPGEDSPNDFPGSKKNQPKNLRAPWKNYAMCTNYSQTTTPNGSTMDVCFNPYIETSPGIPSGTSSNCMSCHGTARVTSNPNGPFYPSDYKAPIAFYTDPLYFNDSTMHTEFSWAIADA